MMLDLILGNCVGGKKAEHFTAARAVSTDRNINLVIMTWVGLQVLVLESPSDALPLHSLRDCGDG